MSTRFIFWEPPPEAVDAVVRLKAEQAGLRVLRDGWLLAGLLAKANFDPAQPRVPAGESDGGRWSNTGGGGFVRIAGGAEDDENAKRGSLEEFLDPMAEPRQEAFNNGLNTLRRLEPFNSKLVYATDADGAYVPTQRALDNLDAEIEAARDRVAKSISSGHALAAHDEEFGYPTQSQLEGVVSDVLRAPSRIVDLPDNRTAYYRRSDNTLVITNPKDRDGGSVYKPLKGEEYLTDLIERR